MKLSIRMIYLSLDLVVAICFAFTVNAQTEKKQKEEVASICLKSQSNIFPS